LKPFGHLWIQANAIPAIGVQKKQDSTGIGNQWEGSGYRLEAAGE
jgi:hypothetical protein